MYLAFGRIRDFRQYKKYHWYGHLAECTLFSTINAIPTYVIAKDRGASDKEAFKGAAFMVGVYAFGYNLLEGGGFFTNTLCDKDKLKFL